MLEVLMISLKHIKNSKKQQQYYLLDGQREEEFILTKQIHSHKQQFIYGWTKSSNSDN